MNGKLKWFGIGFITATLFLMVFGYFWNHRSENVLNNLPKEQQEIMLSMSPWLKSARAGRLGPFNAIVPASRSEKNEAYISPPKGYPILLFSENSLSFIDSKSKVMSLKYNESTGEFKSYELLPDPKGATFFDDNLDGQFDIKLGPGTNLAVNYESEWLPVIRKDKKKFIEINGIEKEIELPNAYLGWKFVGQK